MTKIDDQKKSITWCCGGMGRVSIILACWVNHGVEAKPSTKNYAKVNRKNDAIFVQSSTFASGKCVSTVPSDEAEIKKLQYFAISFIQDLQKLQVPIMQINRMGGKITSRMSGTFAFQRSPLKLDLAVNPLKKAQQRTPNNGGQRMIIDGTFLRLYTHPKGELIQETDISLSPFVSLLSDTAIDAHFRINFEKVSHQQFILNLTHNQDMTGSYIKLLFTLVAQHKKSTQKITVLQGDAKLQWSGWVVLEPQAKETVVAFIDS